MRKDAGTLIVLKRGETLRFRCRFCKMKFDSSSKCAKHIEKASTIGICYPDDIEVVIGRRKKK
jgi:hypothetical protein